MDFIKHSSCNAQLGPPPGVSDADCGTLPTKRWRMPGWGPVETSFWKPSEADLAALNAGGSVAVNLHVGPGQHPMMSTQVYAADIHGLSHTSAPMAPATDISGLPG